MNQNPVKWELKSIGEWGITADSGFASGAHNSTGNGVVHLRPMNIDREGRLDFTLTKFVDAEVSSKRIEKGDVLFNNTNSSELVGKTAIFDENQPLAFSNHMTRLKVPKETVDAKYFAMRLHTLWSDGYFKEICSNHVNQASVSTKRLLQVNIALPPIEVQRKIVETIDANLSRIDKALIEIEQGRSQSESLVRSIRRDVFSPEKLPEKWEMTSVGAILLPFKGKRLTQRGWSPQCLNHTRESADKWGVLKTTAIQPGEFQPQFHKELPTSLEPKPEIEVKQGDIIMTATGPRNRCGIPCLVVETPSRLMMSGKMFRARTDESICDPRWLLGFLLSDAGQSQLERLKVGSSDSSVSIGAVQFERVELPLPPLMIQQEILHEMDQKVASTKHFDRAIESTSMQAVLLRRALLHAAFSGKLLKEEIHV